jgi:atypical dual specificity phosphatase
MRKSSTKHGKLRFDILISTLNALFRSKLVFWAWSVFASVAFRLILSGYSAITWLVFAVPIAWGASQRRELLYEFRLLYSTIGNYYYYDLGSYTLVEDSLYLGGIPMEPDGTNLLLKKLGINSIVSVFEGNEFDSYFLVGKPVSPADWRACNVQQMVLTMHESERNVPASTLHKAADFINASLSKGQRMYVHCRSGRWQGATIVLAYYIKYLRCTATQSIGRLKKSRAIGFDVGSPEWDALVKFEKSFRS